MSTTFLGAWLVSEYVYHADGSLAGINYQRRVLEQIAAQQIRVTQTCAPAPELATHALARFRGEWVFELAVDGRARRYLGPDVVGTGLAWGAGALTGRGLWPRLGFNFTSFSLLPTPERQLTGGKFFAASELKANIVGIAVNEAHAEGRYPEFGAQTHPAELSAHWAGTLRTVSADGTLLSETPLTRDYSAEGWHENSALPDWHIAPGPDASAQFIAADSAIGLAKRTGHLLEAELVQGPTTLIEMMEVFDPIGQHLVGLRQWYTDHIVSKMEVIFLKPA